MLRSVILVASCYILPMPGTFFMWLRKRAMRNLFFLLLIFPSLLQAQVAAKGDTILYSKILIIPSNPMMHLSDADDEISVYSEKNKEQIRAQFRDGLLQYVDESLLTAYRTYALKNSSRGDEVADLETIYGSLNYSMDTVYPVSHPSSIGKD